MTDNKLSPLEEAVKRAKDRWDDIGEEFSESDFIEGWNAYANYQKHHTKELLDALKEVSPLIDEIILRLPTGKNRNDVCDFNIKIKSIIQKHEGGTH